MRGHNEGSIWQRKDKDGRVTGYTAEVTIRGTGSEAKRAARKRRSFKTKAEARAWLDEARQLERSGRLGVTRDCTVAAYLDEWLETVKYSVKPRTHEVYGLNVRRLVTHLGHIRLDALRPQQVQFVYTQLLNRGLAARSVKQAHVVLHKALKDAERLDLITRNASAGATMPRPAAYEHKTLSVEQLLRLFEATEGDRFHALWVLLSTSGLRIGEALALRWEDIDLAAGTLVVRRALQRHQSAGLVFVEPKSKRALRTVHLGDRVVREVKARKERQAFEKKVAADEWHDQDLVFCTAFGTPLDRGRVHLNWSHTLQRVGIDHVRIHDLRHTAATLMLKEGIHPRVVQEMLGHSTISVTLDTYSHVAPTMHREAADRIDALLAASDR